MLINDLRAMNVTFSSKQRTVSIRDAVVFWVDEMTYDFIDMGMRLAVKDWGAATPKDLPWLGSAPPYAQWLPYDNFVIQFQDSVFWYFEAKPQAGFFVNSFCKKTIKLYKDEYYGKIMYIFSGFMQLFETDGSLYTIEYHDYLNNNQSCLDDMDEDHKQVALDQDAILRKFLAFLACTNVRTLDGHPDAKLQKARKKRGKLPLVSYKVLQLRPAGGGTNDDPKHLWSNRVHLCRGHMAEYGVNGKGLLFGKYSGSFWIPPHVKGDKKQGLVVKDYQLPVEEQ